MTEKVASVVLKVYFTAVAFMMYYFLTEAAYIGGIGVTYRHLFALLLVVSAFVYFLISPDIARGAVSVKGALVYAVPLLVVLVASMLVWFVDKSSPTTIQRGISGCLFYTNWLSCALAAGALLYVFGEAGIWYNLLAMVSANLLMLLSIMREGGVGTFFGEFVTLVTTFAGTTGELIVKAEVHELAFCFGAYLLYMLYKPQKKAWFWILFSLSAFCFLTAFKRIAMVAIAAALILRLAFFLVSKMSKRAMCRLANGVMLFAVVLLIAYIAAIKADVFSLLEKAGVDTSGRAYVYAHVNEYYRFSPAFVGNGIGFLTYQLNEVVSLGVSAVHNDFLQFFVDLGFFGYILWLLSMTVLRTAYFGRDEDGETAAVTASLILYLLIVSATDNTINYPLLTTVLGVLMMGNGYTRRVERQHDLLRSRAL